MASRHRATTLLIGGLVSLALSACTSTPVLRPFITDGCSLFPDRSTASGQDWCPCCVTHDRAYWRGGTASQGNAGPPPSFLDPLGGPDARRQVWGRLERLRADEALRDCVVATTRDESLAALMYRGVRIGGSPYLPTPFRWGYGWPFGRFYQQNAPAEDATANQLEAAYAASVGWGACPSRVTP